MSARPLTLTTAAAIQALEGLLVVGAGGYVAYETMVGEPRDFASAVALAVIAMVAGVLMIVVGRGLLRALRWSRSPAVLTQIFVAVVAVPMAQGGQYAAGVPLVVAALVALLLLLAPATGHALDDDRAEPAGSPDRSDQSGRSDGDQD